MLNPPENAVKSIAVETIVCAIEYFVYIKCAHSCNMCKCDFC